MAEIQRLVEQHGAAAVGEAFMEILMRDYPEIAEWPARRAALLEAAKKFNLVRHTAQAVETKGRNN